MSIEKESMSCEEKIDQPKQAEAGSSSARKSLYENWRELLEERGFTWPEEDEEFAKDLREAMEESDGAKVIERYHRLCRRRLNNSGHMRLALFLMLSIKLDFMSEEQYYGAKSRVDKLFEAGEPTSAFFFMHLVTSESVERFQCHAINLDRAYAGRPLDDASEDEAEKEEDDEKEEEKSDEEDDGDFLSEKAMMMAFGEIETQVSDWVVAMVCFAQRPAEKLSLNDSAKLHAVTMMDTVFPGCTLADAEMAMRGIDFMHMYHSVKEGDRFQKLAQLSARYEKLGVRVSSRLSKIAGAEHVDPRVAFGKSFQTLVAYIICDRPPQIPRSEVDGFDYTTRSELLLARTLRRFRRDERKRLIKAKEMKKDEKVAITIPEQVLLQVERIAKTNTKGERKYVPGELYARLRSISLECAIAWLHCAMCASESVLDWYWFMEGANVYSKFRENSGLFDQIQQTVKKLNEEEAASADADPPSAARKNGAQSDSEN